MRGNSMTLLCVGVVLRSSRSELFPINWQSQSVSSEKILID